MQLAAKAFVGAVLFCSLSAGQTGETGLLIRNPTIRSSGSAVITAKPDQVRIDIGVVTQASTAQTAGAENAKQFSAVLSELKKALGEGSDIQTVSYGITPSYRYPKEGGTPAIVGYTATNVVRVVSGDVNSAGKVIDAATRTGANAVRSIEFSVKNERALREKALAEAAKQARANVEAIASGLGLRVTRVLRVEDGSPSEPPRPMREVMYSRAAAMSDAPPTPVEAGTIKVEANVTLTAEIAP